MLDIPDVAIGPVIAAAIAAVLSFVGLVITKEQKTSEFRQEWIDGLREELKIYLATVTLIADLEAVNHKTIESRVKFLKDYYHELNKASYAISLRINPLEEDSQNLIAKMIALKRGIDNNDTGNNFSEIEKEFLIASQMILKKEWARVKRGEKTFSRTKWIMALVASIVIVVMVYSLVRSEGAAKPSGHTDHHRGNKSAAKAGNEILAPPNRGTLLPTPIPHATLGAPPVAAPTKR